MFRPGYAVEYDYFPPTQLKHTLETKIIENLFFSGQINGMEIHLLWLAWTSPLLVGLWGM